MRNGYQTYAWGVLAYNLGVILWGAYVRATGSGAGCGSHWPLCNGQVVPRSPRLETLIEFTHRLSSGLAFILVLGLLIWAWRIYPRRHQVQFGAGLAMFFMVTEALVGAGLVLFELVAKNDSLARALSVAIHLVNTFLLLAFLALTAWWASSKSTARLSLKTPIGILLMIGISGMIVLGASGALTALGDTLFPAASLGEGFQQDFSPTAHFLIRLRVLHPTLAALVGGYLILLASLVRLSHQGPLAHSLAAGLALLVIVQLAAGFINVILLAPVWLQMVHLLLADLGWITLVLLTASYRAFQ